MTSDPLQVPGDETTLTLEELLAASRLARNELLELVEFGVFEPLVAGKLWRFRSSTIVPARRAARLRDDFGLNPPGMVLALAYLERIDELERRLRELECQMLRG
jgi:chaperone modulatory protein CbpM